MTIKAAIFDFDGTLIDSEENYLHADQRLLSKYGINFTKEMKADYIGMGNSEMMRKIKDNFNIPDSAEKLLQFKNEIYLEIAKKNTPVYPKMVELVKELHKKRIPLAIASGTSPQVLNELLRVTSLAKYFLVVISSEEVARAKPEPDIFLEAAKRLKITPAHCLVVEDSQYGVEAGKKAGMMVVAVPYLANPPLAPSFHKADLLFSTGMSAFESKKVLRWIECFDAP
ncbi:MAG: HAD family phosphatase [Pseudomonadota bacterium]